MLASVVIITRNRAEILLRCLKSIASQDYPQVEIIVVDNASTDTTAQDVKTHYPAATLLLQDSNKGIPGGRNIGIAHARGQVCICIDDDAEFIDNGSISACMRYFAQDETLACLGLRIVDQHGMIVRKFIARRDRKIITADTKGAMFAGTGFAVSRAAFTQVGGFWEELNPYFGEEPDISFRLLDAGYTILHTPSISVRHYETPQERPKGRRIYYGTRNTPWLALRSLPWYGVISLTIFGWGYFFVCALKEKQLRMYGEAVVESLRHMPAVYRIRKPVTAQTRRLLWTYSGLLFY